MSALVPIIVTARLELVPGTVEQFEADLRGDGSLAPMLEAEAPPASDWPVEHWDEGAIRWSIDKVKRVAPEELAWWVPRYVVLREGGRRLLVGGCGIKGPPGENGEVEIGYGVIRSQRRRGIAREAAGGIIQWAWRDARVKMIVGQTLTGDEKSAGVLLRNGFVFAGKGFDPTEPDVERYELKRAR